MAKKMIVLMAAAAFLGGLSTAALAAEGKVTAVDGDLVTVQVDKKDAKKISEGDSVTLKVKKGKAPKAGMDALTGC
ncbi:MAG: hypothetical protein PHV45_02870 [Desulfuromonas thiophila]|nr:hypothetical protein [Desulfuromonas thiophila]